MKNERLTNRIKEFIERKHFDNPFVQECITEFIEGHMELYGDIISEDELFSRLDENLDKITFAGQSPSLITMGEYKGRVADDTDVNEIILYYDESELDIPEYVKPFFEGYTQAGKDEVIQKRDAKRADIKSTLIHELTHAAYTIKGDFGIGEKHVFSHMMTSIIFKEYRNNANYTYVEPIVNYISSRIEGKDPEKLETYKFETQAIYMLAEKVDEKSIIRAAWESDEYKFKKTCIDALCKDEETGEKSYSSFEKGVEELAYIRKYGSPHIEDMRGEILKSKKILSELQQILNGETLEQETDKTKDEDHKDIEDTKNPEYTKAPEDTKIPEDIKFTNLPEQEESSSFSKKFAKFLSKHNSLMKVPFIKKYVDKHFPTLPPAENESTDWSKRTIFINGLTNNGEYLYLQPQKQQEKSLDKTNEQTIDDSQDISR